MRRGIQVSTLAIAALAAAALAACSGGSGGSDPTSEPTPTLAVTRTPRTPSRTPTPSPTRTGPLTTGPNVKPGEKPPVMPAAARQHDADGALLFADYWVKALDWSVATNNGALLKSASASTCQACQRFIQGIADVVHSGGRESGGRIHLQTITPDADTHTIKSDEVFKVTLVQDTAVVIKPGSPPSTTRPTNPSSDLLFVSWRQNHWLTIEFTATK